MLKRKRIKTRGKIPLTRIFQKFKEGDSVALVQELSMRPQFPKRMQGRTGKIIEKRGSAYVVEVKDLNLAKRFCVNPAHLKKIEVSE